jgi:prepilin peptidase CpaA
MTNAAADWIHHLAGSALDDARIALLALLLIAAAAIDWRTFRIPNWLTAGGLVIGLALNTAGALRPLDGLLWALGGAAVGLLIPLPLYAFRVMGAGDVKLMAMAGAFLGLGHVFPALLFVFVTGGIAAMVFAFAHNRLPRLAANLRNIVQGTAFSVFAGQPPTGMVPGASIGKLPYGVSISAGTILYLAAWQLGYL